MNTTVQLRWAEMDFNLDFLVCVKNTELTTNCLYVQFIMCFYYSGRINLTVKCGSVSAS